MDQETTVRVTLCKLKLLESVTKYSRAFVTITFGKLSRSVPNPRFIKNKEANFYHCRLNLTNKISEKAFIKVYGMNSTGYQMEEIGFQYIYVLSIKQNKSFVLSNNKVRLQYEVALVKNNEEEQNVEDQIKTEMNLDTQKLRDGICFEPTSRKRASIHKYLSQNRVKTSDDQNTSTIFDRSPLLSQQQYKHAHDTLTMYKQDQNKDQSNKISDQLWINRSQFNFLQPVTHTPPRSPRTQGKQKRKVNQYFSLNKNDSNEFQNKLSKAKQEKPYLKNNTQSNNVLYLIISIIAFVLGILVKQNI